MFKAQPKKKKPWYLDNGCSRHMTSDKSLFQQLDGNRNKNVTFSDNSKRVIQGIGTIDNTSQTLIKHVLYGEGFMHNLFEYQSIV